MKQRPASPPASTAASARDPWAQPGNRRWTASDIARAERQLLMLREIADVGMDMARQLQREALDELAAEERGSPPVRQEGEDFGQAFERVARAIRQGIILEVRIAEKLEEQKEETLRAKRRAERIERMRSGDRTADQRAAPSEPEVKIRGEQPLTSPKGPTRH